MSTNTALPERGDRTCKVAIPMGLHGATKAVAARLGQSVQDLVAELLRRCPKITAEEKRNGGAL